MTNILGESGDTQEDVFGKRFFRDSGLFPVEQKVQRKRDKAADKEAKKLEAFRKSLEPAERVTTIAEDASAQKRRAKASRTGTGKQSTILTGVQTALKKRLGE